MTHRAWVCSADMIASEAGSGGDKLVDMNGCGRRGTVKCMMTFPRRVIGRVPPSPLGELHLIYLYLDTTGSWWLVTMHWMLDAAC